MKKMEKLRSEQYNFIKLLDYFKDNKSNYWFFFENSAIIFF